MIDFKKRITEIANAEPPELVFARELYDEGWSEAQVVAELDKLPGIPRPVQIKVHNFFRDVRQKELNKRKGSSK